MSTPNRKYGTEDLSCTVLVSSFCRQVCADPTLSHVAGDSVAGGLPCGRNHGFGWRGLQTNELPCGWLDGTLPLLGTSC